MPDVRTLADLAAEKIRGGYNAPHAAWSALKDFEVPREEREQLFHDILRELSRRRHSRARSKKNKKKKTRNDPKRLAEALKKEREMEAYRMMYERGDHLLPDP